MKYITTRVPIVLVAAGLMIGLSACDDSDPVGPEETIELEVQTVEDLPADPATRIGPRGPEGLGQFTFFSLRDNEVVLAYDAESRADSATTEWDIALQGTTVRVNGGVSGPGEGAAYVAEAAFEEVVEVGVDQLETDADDALAIPTGSDDGWYNYNANGNNLVRPIPGRTLVIRTADGDGYAKIRIVSYYEGAPDDLASSDAEARYYTFDYVYQPDGTRFE